MDGVSHTWDANGNLLDDGTNTYTYDPANRLSSVSGSLSASYAYNGLGNRLEQTVGISTTTYILDLNAGLTQVLNDGTNTYLYGNGRIAQSNTTTQYFLGDALGSVRQMTNPDGAVVLAKAYDPYGVDILDNGAASTSYGFTGEQTDPTGMVYLRARYYAPTAGRFMSRDTWGGVENQPLSFNRWNYTNGNPVNLTDSTGMSPECDPIAGSARDSYLKCEKIIRGIDPENAMTLGELEAWDASGATPECPLYMYLDMPVPSNEDIYAMSEDYGYWFHYMLSQTPGGWNMGGRGQARTSFFIAASLGITREAGPDSNRAGLLPILAESFTRKGWTQGFYYMLGSRIRATVDSALLTSGGLFSFYDRNRSLPETATFQLVLDRFANGPQGVNNPNAYKTDDTVYGEMYEALTNPSFHNDGGGDAPYEWGNPTNFTKEHYPNLFGTLQNEIPIPQKRTGRDQIYYRIGQLSSRPVATNGVYLGAFFALTLNQIQYWCGGHSCVH